MSILGIVLAGGRSSRFGSDKADAMFQSRSLLVHAIRALEEQVDEIAVAGREASGFLCLADRPAPGLGPLGGLCGGLEYAEAHGHEAVVTTACDVPRLPADLVHDLRGDDAAYVADIPVIGFWPVGLHRALESYLAAGARRSMFAWTSHINARAIKPSDPIANINTQDDLARFSE